MLVKNSIKREDKSAPEKGAEERFGAESVTATRMAEKPAGLLKRLRRSTGKAGKKEGGGRRKLPLLGRGRGKKGDLRSGIKGLPRPARQVLVFDINPAAVSVFIARRQVNGTISFGAAARSGNADLDKAISEVIADLKSQTKRLPREAVLVSPLAAARLLSLPVAPDRPRPREQMTELIRYEMEEAVVAGNDLITPVALLQERGLLSYEQRCHLEEQARCADMSVSELCEQTVGSDAMGMVLQQLDQLLVEDESLRIGWAGQPGNEDDGYYPWLGGAIPADLARRYVEVLRRHKIRLQWIYPQAGLAAVHLGEEQRDWLLVDVRQEHYVLVTGGSRGIDNLLMTPCSGAASGEEIAEAVYQMLASPREVIVLNAPQSMAEEISAALEARLQAPVAVLSAPLPGDEKVWPVEALVAMRAAARHALKGGRPLQAVAIRAQTPPPPVWKRKQYYPLVALVLVVAGLYATDVHLRNKTEAINFERDLLDIEYDRRMKIIKEAQALAAEVGKLQRQLDDKEAELSEQRRLGEVLDTVIRYRQDLIPGLLDAFAVAANDGVIFDLVEETKERDGFYLEGWALQDTLAQSFVSELNRQLEKWDYEVRDSKLNRGRNRLNLNGYVLKIWIYQQGHKSQEPQA